MTDETKQPGAIAQGEAAQEPASQAMAWHLFRVDASDEDGCYSVITSAQSESEAKAQELAEAAVLDDLGTAESPAEMDSTTYLGRCENDIWEKIGPI